MLLAALTLLLVCLLALLFFKDYKIRSRMKLSEKIPGPKALPLLGNLLDIGLNSDSKLHMFVCLSIRHERHHGALRHYDFGNNNVVYVAEYVIRIYAKFINWPLSCLLIILLLNLWVIRNYVLTLLYCVIYGELWVQLVELYCLSEPGYVDFMEGLIHNYGPIVRAWAGPYLGVVLTEAKYVEVSKLALAL